MPLVHPRANIFHRACSQPFRIELAQNLVRGTKRWFRWTALPIILQPCRYSGCLCAASVQLVKAALAKGITHWLASQGGWQNERFLRGDKPAPGALWQRTAPDELGLTFSPASLEFLIWLTTHDPLDEAVDPWSVLPELNSLSAGDQVLLSAPWKSSRY